VHAEAAAACRAIVVMNQTGPFCDAHNARRGADRVLRNYAAVPDDPL
jgi:hypothetical protein